jgi:hypothetical protein
MTPLPESGAERDIFIAGLRELSDACEAPALQPTCPFAIETAPGVRGCAEQCMDLLARFEPVGGIAADVVALGDGIALHRRRRARRGPDPATRAFDAKEFWLLDEEKKDLAQWRTVSLFYGLRGSATSSPTLDPVRRAERAQRLRGCLAELRSRGFDAELLVREGLGRSIAAAIGIAVVFPNFIRSEDPDAPELAEFEAPEGWLDLFELISSGDLPLPFPTPVVLPTPIARVIAAAGGAFNRKLTSWVMLAPLDDVLDWRPPDYESFVALPDSANPHYLGPHEWIVARFLETYLTDWPTPALHLEWEYAHARRLPPSPTKEMTVRRIDPAELGRVIADRAVGKGFAVQPSYGAETARNYVPYAVRAIKEGRLSVAADVFGATVQLAPNSIDTQNNFGFCILLSRPADALVAFEEASRLGDDSAMNAGNRMLALMHLGRTTTALEVADRFVGRYSESAKVSGWMWDPDSTADDPNLVDVPDMRVYVLDLAVLVAQRTGDQALVAKWTKARVSLRGDG